MICLKSLEQPCYSDEQMEEIIPKLLMFEKKTQQFGFNQQKERFFCGNFGGKSAMFNHWMERNGVTHPSTSL
jgi:hypothetical protein